VSLMSHYLMDDGAAASLASAVRTYCHP